MHGRTILVQCNIQLLALPAVPTRIDKTAEEFCADDQSISDRRIRIYTTWAEVDFHKLYCIRGWRSIHHWMASQHPRMAIDEC